MIAVKAEDMEKQVQYLVQNLDNFEHDKALKAGLRKGVNVFRVKGKSNLRTRLMGHGRQTGHLMNSFTTRVKRNKAGALAGFDRPGGNHSHLVDLGTVRRKTKKTGADRGVMPANRFWSDAQKSEAGKAMNAVYEGVKQAVERLNERRNA